MSFDLRTMMNLFHLFWIQCFILNMSADQHGIRYSLEINDKFDVILLQSSRFDFVFLKKVASNIYIFESNATRKSEADKMLQTFREFFSNQIVEAEPYSLSGIQHRPPTPYLSEKKKLIYKRSLEKSTLFKSCPAYYDPDVERAWSLGFTGKGVTVAIVDTGVYINHPDLKRNINKALSFSFVNEDNTSHVEPQRSHNYREYNKYTNHGTLAAGIVGAEMGNDVCFAGVAFNSSVAALKVFHTDQQELQWTRLRLPLFNNEKVPAALEHKRDVIDIYSCSFNLDNPFTANVIESKTVLKGGVEKGRQGKGSIFVFSAGNYFGPNTKIHDRNMEFYASSIYTITIASVGRHGKRPKYVRPGACILAATFGDFRTWSGDKLQSTSNWDSCAEFQGTSAAAARASGMIAIMLEANPRLTCRDVQYIIVLTSSLENVERYGNSVQNAAGLKFDKYFGFGLMNATAMVMKARVWIPVARQLSYTTTFNKDSDKVFTSVVSANTSVPPLNESLYPKLLEQVAVFVDIEISNTKVEDIDIVLKSPSKTLSYLLSHKKSKTTKTKSIDGPAMIHWTFTSVHFWGELLTGEWKIFFKKNQEQESLFTIRNISISFYGVSDLKEASTINSYIDPDDISDESDIDDIAEKVCEFAGEQYEEIKRNPHLVIDAIGWIVGISLFICLLIWCYVKRSFTRPLRGDNQEHPEEELRLQQGEEPRVASDD